MLNGRNQGFPNVVARDPCKAVIHHLVLWMLLEITNGGELGKRFNNVSCQLSSTLPQQNVSINQTLLGNSTFELRKKCGSIDPSCSCDSPQKMRCHNPSITALNDIINRMSATSDLDIKTLLINKSILPLL